MSERTIAYLPLADLRPAKRNPKLHDAEGVTASIGRFGVIEVQVLDERTGRIISGHGRLESFQAAEAAGDTPPDGVVIDAEGRWTVPVVLGWRSKNNAEAEAALVALNRLGETGGWDAGAVTGLLERVAELSPGLAGTGFTLDQLAEMRAALSAPPAAPSNPFGGTGVRSIVLDYPLNEFDRLARQLQELRRHMQIDTNAEVVLALVAEEAERSGIRLGG